MATISLNIYKAEDKTQIEKTYTAEGYNLMLGTIEDFMAIIDIDKLDNNIEIAKMVMSGYSQIKPLIKDIFPELSDDEFRRVKLDDLIRTILQVGTSVVENLNELKSGN